MYRVQSLKLPDELLLHLRAAEEVGVVVVLRLAANLSSKLWSCYPRLEQDQNIPRILWRGILAHMVGICKMGQ